MISIHTWNEGWQHLHGAHNQKSHGRAAGRAAADEELVAAQGQIPADWVDAHVMGSSPNSAAGAAWSGYITPGDEGEGYDGVQTPLRTGRGSQARANDMRQAFADRHHITTQEITVYRGVNDAGKLTPGQMLHERGFTSTSTDHDVADQFAQGDFGGSGRGAVRLEITVPRESAVLAGDISLNELVLAPSAGLVIDSVGTDRDSGGRTIQTAQVRYVAL